MSALISPGIYQWRAQAFDGRDWSPVSETRTFTLTLPELTLNTLKTVALNSGETLRYKLNVPQADNLFVTVRSVEQFFLRLRLPYARCPDGRHPNQSRCPSASPKPTGG